MAAASQGYGLFPLEGDGDDATVCVSEARFKSSENLPVVGRHAIDYPTESWLRVRHTDFERALRAELRELFPSIELTYCTTGPRSPVVSIDPTGRLRGTHWDWESERQQDFGRNELVGLIDVAVQRGYFDWPAVLGRSLSPCSSFVRIRIRTERGSRLVHIAGPPPADASALEREAHAHACAIMKAIPFTKTWTVSGR